MVGLDALVVVCELLLVVILSFQASQVWVVVALQEHQLQLQVGLVEVRKAATEQLQVLAQLGRGIMAEPFLLLLQIMLLVVVVVVRLLAQRVQVQTEEMVERELLVQSQVQRSLVLVAEAEEQPMALAGQVVLVEVGQLLQVREPMEY